MTYQEIVQLIPQLTIDERRRLIRAITDTLPDGESQPAPKKRSILEFEGIAKRLADDEDPQTHVKRLRSEWNDRP